MSRNGRTVVDLAVAALLAAACGQEPATSPAAGPAALARAPGGGGSTSITVSAADPDTVPIATTLTIRILGSGFAPGATVEYLLAGTVTNKLKATSVTYVSGTELSTTTAISADAALASYDIAVTVGGKRGVGAEKVEVVAKPVDLPEPGGVRSEANDVNEAGVIVGAMADASGSFFAMRWVPQGGTWSGQSIGAGSAIAINNLGEILRRYYDGTLFHTWIRLSNGSEVYLGPGSYGAGIGDDGTVIGAVDPSGGPSIRAVIWRRADGWQTPIVLPTLPGYRNDAIYGISSDGRRLAGTVRSLADPTHDGGAVWSWDGTTVLGPTLMEADLSGGPRAVNNTGGLAGWWWPCLDGTCQARAAYWPAAGAPRQLLPDQSPRQSVFNDINNRNQMVGRGSVILKSTTKGRTNYQYNQPILWMPGAPKPFDLNAFRALKFGEAFAINNTGLAVGTQQDASGTDHAIVWILP